MRKQRVMQSNKGHWESYALIDGLPDINVLAILEDKEGYLWFGTEDGGVSRYDGQAFVNFSTEEGLAGNRVMSILQDGEGNLWFGVGGWGIEGGGVSRYDGDSFVTFTTEDGLAGNSVWSILEDREGNLWFGTFGGGVSRYDGRNFVTLTARDGLAGNRVTSIIEDRDGNFWFGTYFGGVSRFDGDSFVNFATNDGLADNRVTSVVEDREGNIWFGTYDGGVSRFDGSGFANFTARDGLADNRVTSILEDSEGDLWFATYSGGVSRYDGTSFLTFTIEDGLADNRVASILEDREGYLWFGTYAGISRYDRYGFVTFAAEDGLAHNDVRAILEDTRSCLWFGTNGGVSRYDGESFVTFTAEDGLAHNDVRAILEDTKGSLWFGTYSGGVSRYDGESFVTFARKDGLANDNVWAIAEDRKGCLWFGTNGGVSRYDGHSFVTFTRRDGLAHDHVWSIAEDREGNLWFATLDGVSLYDGDRFTTFTTRDGLAHNHVWSVVEDRGGHVYLSTRGGVSRSLGKPGEREKQGARERRVSLFQTISVKDGLPCKNVRSILEDREGCFWFGTNGGGVCKYDGKNFQDITTRDGLAHDTVRQMIQDKAGNFWFATPNRVTKHTPIPHKVKPRIRVTQAIADRVHQFPVSKGGQGFVSHNMESSEDQVTFIYSGLSFKTKFDKIKYIHRLEGPMDRATTGRDTTWSQATHQLRVRYEDLEPGEYLFQVKSIDRDLNYSDAAQVKLTVIPDPRNHQIAQLEERLREQERAEMERIYRELDDAREIQTSLLPKHPPQIEGFDIAGTSLSAREVGGDFYDYLSLGENLGIILADVSGKSVKAAMVAAMANGMLHTEVKGQRDIWNSPRRILSELNTALEPRLTQMMFIAMSLGILRTGEKRFLFSNAGMPYPIVRRGARIRELEVNGLPLGIIDGAEYSDLSVDLEPGDLVVFYSDGVSEASNKAGKLYGAKQVLEAVRQADSGISAQEMVDWILRDVTTFVGGDTEPSDDITLVVLRYDRPIPTPTQM